MYDLRAYDAYDRSETQPQECHRPLLCLTAFQFLLNEILKRKKLRKLTLCVGMSSSRISSRLPEMARFSSGPASCKVLKPKEAISFLQLYSMGLGFFS